MKNYTTMGIPSGSLSEIYLEFRRLQRQVAGRRDIFMTIFLTIVVLLASVLLPVVVTKVTYDKDDGWEIWRRQSQMLEAMKRDNEELQSMRDALREVKQELEKLRKEREADVRESGRGAIGDERGARVTPGVVPLGVESGR